MSSLRSPIGKIDVRKPNPPYFGSRCHHGRRNLDVRDIQLLEYFPIQIHKKISISVFVWERNHLETDRSTGTELIYFEKRKKVFLY